MGPPTSLDYNVAHLVALQSQMTEQVRTVKTVTIFDSIDLNFKKAAKKCREHEAEVVKRVHQSELAIENVIAEAEAVTT